MMEVGWIFWRTSSFAPLRNSAASITTEVVPSPTSWSWRSASSQRTLAAGCSTSNSFNIVAPSFVTVTSYKNISELGQVFSSIPFPLFKVHWLVEPKKKGEQKKKIVKRDWVEENPGCACSLSNYFHHLILMQHAHQFIQDFFFRL